MSVARILRIYLDPDELERARSGDFKLMNRIRYAFEDHEFRVEFMRNSVEQRLKSVDRNGYALFHMQDPFHSRALNLRRAYFYPYWRIENTADRWEFEVAKKYFDPGEIETDIAQKWARNWRKWLFKGAASNPVREGLVYVPLQGKLLRRRSFQTVSPIEMIKTVLQQDTKRQILVGLHPNESYSHNEILALQKLAEANLRLSIQTGGMNEALRICDYVVTENSSAALSGFFFGKPAILFARIDFHHIALNIEDLGAEVAFEEIEQHQPEFKKYLYWFIQLNAIKAGDDHAEEAIIETVRQHGWKV